VTRLQLFKWHIARLLWVHGWLAGDEGCLLTELNWTLHPVRELRRRTRAAYYRGYRYGLLDGKQAAARHRIYNGDRRLNALGGNFQDGPHG